MAARYTLILGTKEWSSWSLRPYLAMRATGAEFREVVVPLRRDTTSPEIRKYSPTGRVPVLDIEESGKTITVFDSLAICETLAERHPDAQLWPSDPHIRALARSYACEMHSSFVPLRSVLPMDIALTLPTPALDDGVKTDIARIIAAWTEALTRYAKDGGFLFGRFSIADCMYAPVVTRFRTYGIELPAIIEAYSDRVFALPAMQDWIDAAKTELETLPQAPTAIL